MLFLGILGSFNSMVIRIQENKKKLTAQPKDFWSLALKEASSTKKKKWVECLSMTGVCDSVCGAQVYPSIAVLR